MGYTRDWFSVPMYEAIDWCDAKEQVYELIHELADEESPERYKDDELLLIPAYVLETEDSFVMLEGDCAVPVLAYFRGLTVEQLEDRSHYLPILDAYLVIAFQPYIEAIFDWTEDIDDLHIWIARDCDEAPVGEITIMACPIPYMPRASAIERTQIIPDSIRKIVGK